MPPPLRPRAVAGAIVAMAMTSSSDNPSSRNFDRVVARSWTGPATLNRCRSELIVSGRQPSASAASAIAHVKLPLIDKDGGELTIESHAARAGLAGRRNDASGVGHDAARTPTGVGVRHDIVGPQPIEGLLDVEGRATDVDHDRQSGGPTGLQRPVQAGQAIRTRQLLRDPDLEPDDEVRVRTRDGGAEIVALRKLEQEQKEFTVALMFR